MILRVSLVLTLVSGMAQADIKTVAEIEAECDTCLARQNGKRALRAYLAEKRAEEEQFLEETQAEDAKDE